MCESRQTPIDTWLDRAELAGVGVSSSPTVSIYLIRYKARVRLLFFLVASLGELPICEMRPKAWTKSPGTFPSDRILPKPSSSSGSKPGAGSKKQASSSSATQGPNKPPKSREVLHIERLIDALRDSSGEIKDPRGGCFCLARDHPLSTYVRMCKSCGLILCSFNMPQYACSFCGTALLSSEERKSLIIDLEQEIADIQKREVEERGRAVEEAKKAAGAFPTLLDSLKQPQPQPQHPPQQQRSTQGVNLGGRPNLPPPSQDTHKVMSLKTRSGKVMISSYTPSSAGSRPASRGPNEEKEAETAARVPCPAREPRHASRAVSPGRTYWAGV